MFAASMQFGKYLFKENKKKLEQKLSLKTSATSKMLWHPWNKYDAMKRGTFREQEQNMSWQFKRMTAEGDNINCLEPTRPKMAGELTSTRP